MQRIEQIEIEMFPNEFQRVRMCIIHKEILVFGAKICPKCKIQTLDSNNRKSSI